jgi:uncharacterized protein (TIGR00251 family)
VSSKPRANVPGGDRRGATTEHSAVILSVRVVPKASRSEIVGLEGDTLRVRVAAPPERGKANKELIKLLAGTFGVRNNQVEIVSGQKARRKRVRVEGVDSRTVLTLLTDDGLSP